MNQKTVALFASTSTLLLILPAVTFALVPLIPPPSTAITSMVTILNGILNVLWPIFAGFAIIMFLIAGFSFLTSQGDPTKVKDARNAIIWGVVGVIVGILAYSISWVICGSLGTC